MKILCQDHYDEVVKYAASIGDQTLHSCLERLESWAQMPSKKCEIELRRDFATYSFLFRERYEDGTVGVEGGLIYHGNPDKSNSYQIVHA